MTPQSTTLETLLNGRLAELLRQQGLEAEAEQVLPWDSLQKRSFLQPRLLAVAAVLSNRVERVEPRAIRLSDHFPAHAAACLCLSCAKS